MLCFAATPDTAPTAVVYLRRSVPTAQQVRLEEELLVLLVTTWAIRTGRMPPARPPGRLTPEELMEFWADDQIAPREPARDRPSAGTV
jgi:hypothetical protein